MSIYDFKIKAQDGSEVMLSDYKGKVRHAGIEPEPPHDDSFGLFLPLAP